MKERQSDYKNCICYGGVAGSGGVMKVSLKKLLLIYEVRIIKVRREREYSRQRHNICKGPGPGRSTVSQGTEGSMAATQRA